MELRQLEYFQMVCRLNNITRAAERLYISQPSVTTAIQKLEAELDMQLFDRSQKQITLTPEGKVFLQRVEIALQTLQDAVLEMNDFRQLQKGTIKIGIPPMIGAYLFPHIFFNFRKIYPDLELSIVEEGSLAIRGRLETGELDLGIVILSNAASILETLPISVGEIRVCLPEHHPLAGLPAIHFECLRDQPFILPKDDSYHRQIILQQCEKHQFEPKIILSSNQIETVKGLIANGVGISFLLDAVADNAPGIVNLPLFEPIYVDIGLAWKKDRYVSKAARAFIEFITGYRAQQNL